MKKDLATEAQRSQSKKSIATDEVPMDADKNKNEFYL
jgi:hypothetical protein